MSGAESASLGQDVKSSGQDKAAKPTSKQKLRILRQHIKAMQIDHETAQRELRTKIATLEVENTGLRSSVEELQDRLKSLFADSETARQLEESQARIGELENTVYLINEDRNHLTEALHSLEEELKTKKRPVSPKIVYRSHPEEMVEELWECNRWTPLIGWGRPSLPTDPHEWGDKNGHQRSFEDVKLAHGWAWKVRRPCESSHFARFISEMK